MKRRFFIKNMGMASAGLVLACNGDLPSRTFLDIEPGHFVPNLFIDLSTDGKLVLTCSRSEMGQGIRTALTSVIADEMGADWKYVEVKQAPGDDGYGNQNTDGSRSIRTIYKPMREMGAVARFMLISAAAKQWNVNASSCRTESHHVINKENGEKLFFGDLVEEAVKEEIPSEVQLRDKKDFKYVGGELPSIDVPDFASGKSKYGLDIKVPGMKYACLQRPPVTFSEFDSYDDTKTRAIPGVEQVIPLKRVEKPFGPLGGIAVIASNSYAAIEGKKALEVQWVKAENDAYSTESFMSGLEEEVGRKGKLIKKEGNVERSFASSEKIVEATYNLPHLVHAPMEPPCATALVSEDGCEVWAPVQAPQVTREEIANLLEIDLEKVTVNVTFLGGGFGRKSKPDFVLEAVQLSAELEKPVQVIWTREDDIKHSYYHANSSQYLKAGIDQQGKVQAWLHRTAYPSITSTFMPGVKHGAGFEFQQGMTNLPYDIPNLRFENGQAEAHLRIGWLRSVYNIIHGFSINVFCDELAAASNMDALAHRLQMIGSDRVYPTDNAHGLDTARMKRVLNAVGKLSDWEAKLDEGKGRGLAVHFSFYSYVASVVEVDMRDERLTLKKVSTVVDCGTVINKNSVKAQMEGAAIFGLSLALYGKITAENGAVEQSNFHDYPLLRFHEKPEIEVEILENKALPTGVGEPGVPVIAPALVNAVYDATGKRYRSLPLADQIKV